MSSRARCPVPCLTSAQSVCCQMFKNKPTRNVGLPGREPSVLGGAQRGLAQRGLPRCLVRTLDSSESSCPGGLGLWPLLPPSSAPPTPHPELLAGKLFHPPTLGASCFRRVLASSGLRSLHQARGGSGPRSQGGRGQGSPSSPCRQSRQRSQ